MKFFFYSFSAFMAIASTANAQVTLDNSIFPQPNAVYTYSSITLDSNMVVSAPSTQAQVWDFRNLSTNTVLYDTIHAASQGINAADYPNADIIQPLIPGLGGTAYVDISATEMYRIGAGLEIMTFAFTAPYSNTHLLQRVPLSMNSNITDTYALSYAEDVDNVPMLTQLIDQYAGSLGISPDSVRVSIAGTRNAKVDAFGRLQLHDGDYDVLRQRVEDNLTIKIEAKVGIGMFSTWMDVTTLLLSQLPTAIPTSYTSVYYDYLANNYGHFIVRQEMNAEGTALQNVYFKGQNTVGVNHIDLKNINIYPNPAKNIVHLNMEALPADLHQVEIIAMDGRIMQTYSNLMGASVQTLDLSTIQTAGVYICRILNADAKIVALQRFNLIP